MAPRGLRMVKDVRAALLVKVKPGKAAAVAKKMRGMEGVATAFPAFGAVDVVARVEVDDREDLAALAGRVGKTSGVLSTETLVELEV